MSHADSSDHLDAIAIVGMAGRFPGARNLDEYWRNLRDGVECITFHSEQEARDAGVSPALLENPNHVRASSQVEGAELFDASFFGFTPREALIMDPQQRVFLECAWEAVENAGFDPDRCEGRVGVYAGVSWNGYLLSSITSNRDIYASGDTFQTMILSDKDYLATWVCYKLNLKGPGVSVQTACSTSLVAVHLACRSLLNGESDVALAGGSTVKGPRNSGYMYQEGGILSPDGHCRAFDASANGTIASDGVGVVVLKRLEDALADGDTIHAVIRGTAINNDGSLKVGYTAPSVEGQAEVIADAQAAAGVEAESITYVEAHGTGTAIGDPIEIAALTKAFRASTEAKGFCAVGSVKANIGHADAASGMAGLIKTVLALKHRQIPPMFHYRRPNPNIDFANSPFFVNAELMDWRRGKTLRRAGVSSFGIGGTNAHVILEEAPPVPAPAPPTRPLALLTVSAYSDEALRAYAERLLALLWGQDAPDLHDLASTLRLGRREFPRRAALLCRDRADAERALADLARRAPEAAPREPSSPRPPLLFAFPGQGSQRAGMGVSLHASEPEFARHLDSCARVLGDECGLDLMALLASGGDAADAALARTEVAQPALFAVEYALARMWMSWGIEPAVMIGHSLGEFVAACLAGVFTPEEGLRLVARRGALMAHTPPGALLVVARSAEQVAARLRGTLAVAADNGPGQSTVAGAPAEVEQLAAEFEAEGVTIRRLPGTCAFHSPLVEEAARQFVREAGRLRLREPQRPYVSNVTGRVATAAEACAPEYWGTHLRQTVRFGPGLGAALEAAGEGAVLLEVGPGRVLSGLAGRASGRGGRVATSLGEGGDEQWQVHEALCRLWEFGAEVSWDAYAGGDKRGRVALPGYPFERRRYWIEPAEAAQTSTRRCELADWFCVPGWRRSRPPMGAGRERGERWLIITDETGLGEAAAGLLRDEGCEVAVAYERGAAGAAPGDKPANGWDGEYVIGAGPDEYARLAKELSRRGGLPQRVLHMRGVSGACEPWYTAEPGGAGGRYAGWQLSVYSGVLHLLQALGGEAGGDDPVEVGVVTDLMQEVTGEEPVLWPEKATVLGPCRVASQEFDRVRCRSIDLGAFGEDARQAVARQLVSEMRRGGPERAVALRGGHRWVESYEAVRLEKTGGEVASDVSGGAPPRVKRGGVYLITGGLGGVGLELAAYLARAGGARLALLGRRGLPPRREWEALTGGGDGDETARRVRGVLALEAAGAEVEVIEADVSDAGQMREAVARVLGRFGRVDGVVHAAGSAGGGLLGAQSAADALEAMRAKAVGAMALREALEGSGAEWVVQCSSVSAAVGGPGQSAYSGANSFLEAYGRRLERDRARGEGPAWTTITVSWDRWQNVGMAAGAEALFKAQTGREMGEAIKPEEGVETFGRALDSGLPHVYVVTQDLEGLVSRMRESRRLSESLDELERTRAAEPAQPRPDLTNGYVAPQNETEEKIADIWQKLFGIERVGAHDNFFQLGGHSLLITQLLNKLRQSFGLGLPMSDVMKNPTVAEMATLVEQGKALEASEGERPFKELLLEAFPSRRQALLEDYLRKRVARALGVEAGQLPADGSLSAVNLGDITAQLIWDFRQDLELATYPHEILGRPAVGELAQFLCAEVERMIGVSEAAAADITPAARAELRPAVGRINARPAPESGEAARTGDAAFILSAPRSGSTLLRVMLAGHPDLFCPAEMGLLLFENISEWKQGLAGGAADATFQWTLQGFQWALMKALNLSAEEGKALLDELVERRASTQSVYGLLRRQAGARLLVDKAPEYAMRPEALERAERIFDGARYVHLVRHPYAVIDSFVRARFDKLARGGAVDPYEMAENVWVRCNSNLLDFFSRVGPGRRHLIRYEELVSAPERVARELCDFLGVPFDGAVLTPYDGKRMVGGVGDPNILQHDEIEARLGEVWRGIKLPRALGPESRRLAALFGYELSREVGREGDGGGPARAVAGGQALPVNLDQLSDEDVNALLESMLEQDEAER